MGRGVSGRDANRFFRDLASPRRRKQLTADLCWGEEEEECWGKNGVLGGEGRVGWSRGEVGKNYSVRGDNGRWGRRLEVVEGDEGQWKER